MTRPARGARRRLKQDDGEHVLVTGGLGFIGSHIADAYLGEGAEVTVVDSMIGSVIDGSHFDRHPRCHVVRRSVENHLASGDALTGIDRVIHAASLVGPAGLLDHTGRVGASITQTSHVVIEACLEADVPMCLFSSAEVYGRSGLLSEADELRIPTNYSTRIEYAVAKALGEVMLVNSLARGLRGIVVRPFNVAGPRQSSAGGFVVPTFVQQALAGKQMTVFWTGEQTRAFVSVWDVTRFVVEFMDKALAAPEVIFNLGHPGNRTTILELANRTKSLLGSNSEIVHVDPKTIHGPLYEEAASIEKVPVLGAAADLGWEPATDLEGLIMATAEYYRHHQDERAIRAAD